MVSKIRVQGACEVEQDDLVFRIRRRRHIPLPVDDLAALPIGREVQDIVVREFDGQRRGRLHLVTSRPEAMLAPRADTVAVIGRVRCRTRSSRASEEFDELAFQEAHFCHAAEATDRIVCVNRRRSLIERDGAHVW